VQVPGHEIPDPVTLPEPVPAVATVSVSRGGGGALRYEYLSALLVALRPAGPTTVTSTVLPGVPAGLNAVIWVALLMVTLVADAVPNWTALALVKPVPVMVTTVPPVAGPALGLTLVTEGGAR
jgi:hypothetical protein